MERCYSISNVILLVTHMYSCFNDAEVENSELFLQYKPFLLELIIFELTINY